MSWKAIAFSEAGTSHQKSGQTCQDYAKFIKLNDFGETVNDGDIIIGAVSKGCEGYKHSDIGSQLAIETALNYLQDRIQFVGVNEAKKNCLLDISKEEADKVVRQFFLQTVEKVSKNLDVKSQELRCYPQDLSCALLVILATPQWLAAMRIGDGLIVIQKLESEPQLLFDFANNKTTFITDSNALNLMQFKILELPELIFASTDSLKTLPIIKGKKPNRSFFDRLRKAITSSSEDQLKALIQKDYNFTNISDNKAFLFCFYKSPLLELNDSNKLLTKQVNELKGELATLQSNNQSLNNQLDRADTQLSILQSERQKLTENLEEKQQELSNLRSDSEALTQQFIQVNQEVKMLELYCQELTGKLDEKDQELLYRLDESQSLNNQLAQVNTQLSTLQSNNQSLNNQLAHANTQLSTLQSNNQSLNNQLAHANQQLSQLQSVKPSSAKLKFIKNLAITSTVIATALASLSLFQYLERNQVIKQIEQLRKHNNLSPGKWNLSSYSFESELENFGNIIVGEKPLIYFELDELVKEMQKKTTFLHKKILKYTNIMTELKK